MCWHENPNVDISKLLDSKNQSNFMAVMKNLFKNGENSCVYPLL